jgi:tetratricopeptide (TPR) repeat protein
VRASFFGFAYLLAALLPVLGLVDTFVFCYSLVFDHFQYLASMGPAALAAAGLTQCSDLALPKRPRLQLALCAGLLLVLAMASWRRTWVYKNHETLWSDTLAKNPNCWVGHNNLGLALFEKGQTEEAVKQIQNALEINPNYVDAHNNLGMVLAQSGRLNEAMTQYQKALGINPHFAVGHYNFGVALSQDGQLDEAVAQYQKALEINPDYAEAHNNLGNALLQKGRLSEATKQYQMALKINPRYAEAHGNLGLVFFQDGRLDEAINQFREALRLNPDLGPVKESLANAQALLRDANQ